MFCNTIRARAMHLIWNSIFPPSHKITLKIFYYISHLSSSSFLTSSRGLEWVRVELFFYTHFSRINECDFPRARVVCCCSFQFNYDNIFITLQDNESLMHHRHRIVSHLLIVLVLSFSKNWIFKNLENNFITKLLNAWIIIWALYCFLRNKTRTFLY